MCLHFYLDQKCAFEVNLPVAPILCGVAVEWKKRDFLESSAWQKCFRNCLRPSSPWWLRSVWPYWSWHGPHPATQVAWVEDAQHQPLLSLELCIAPYCLLMGMQTLCLLQFSPANSSICNWKKIELQAEKIIPEKSWRHYFQQMYLWFWAVSRMARIPAYSSFSALQKS